jgi:hypothetical protein
MNASADDARLALSLAALEKFDIGEFLNHAALINEDALVALRADAEKAGYRFTLRSAAQLHASSPAGFILRAGKPVEFWYGPMRISAAHMLTGFAGRHMHGPIQNMANEMIAQDPHNAALRDALTDLAEQAERYERTVRIPFRRAGNSVRKTGPGRLFRAAR